MNSFIIYGYNEKAKKLLSQKLCKGIICDDDLIPNCYKKIKFSNLNNYNGNIVIPIKYPQLLAAYEYLKIKYPNAKFYDFNKKKIEVKLNFVDYKNYKKKIEGLKKIILKYNFVSFDFFETLIERRVSNPSDIHFLIGNIIKDKKYYLIRKSIENELSRNTKNKYSFKDIAKELHNKYFYSKKKIKKIFLFEKELELKNLFLKKNFKDLLVFCIKNKKKLVIMSDTYFDKKFINKIIKINKIKIFKDIILSSDKKYSKADGSAFVYLKKKYGQSILHIGDNYQDDFLNAKNLGVKSLYIGNLNHYLLYSNFSKIFAYNKSEYGIRSIGLLKKKIDNILGKKINLNKERFINDPKDFGYLFFGPLLLFFISKLVIWSQKNQVEKLLLCSREGYFIKKLLDTIPSKFLKFDYEYFYSSRKLANAAATFNLSDIVKTFSKHRFIGSSEEFLENRIGMKYKKSNSKFFFNTKYKKSKKVLIRFLIDNKKKILQHCEDVRINYIKYFVKIVSCKKKIAFVDQGHVCSVQKGIEKIMKKKYLGFYFYSSSKSKNYFGCFDLKKSFFSKHQIFFESLFTAPHGTVKSLKNNMPVFEKIYTNQKKICFDIKIKIIMGIKKFIIDFYNENKNNHFLYNFANDQSLRNFSDFMFSQFIVNNSIVSKSITNSFYHDNTYVKNNIYQLRFK
jgi:predicted HAD superfamily hydrolase